MRLYATVLENSLISKKKKKNSKTVSPSKFHQVLKPEREYIKDKICNQWNPCRVPMSKIVILDMLSLATWLSSGNHSHGWFEYVKYICIHVISQSRKLEM